MNWKEEGERGSTDRGTDEPSGRSQWFHNAPDKQKLGSCSREHKEANLKRMGEGKKRGGEEEGEEETCNARWIQIGFSSKKEVDGSHGGNERTAAKYSATGWRGRRIKREEKKNGYPQEVRCLTKFAFLQRSKVRPEEN